MSDEELDNVFRTASNGFATEPDMSGWNDMAAKLDKATDTKWYRGKTLLVILFCLVSTGTFFYWYASSSVTIKATGHPYKDDQSAQHNLDSTKNNNSVHRITKSNSISGRRLASESLSHPPTQRPLSHRGDTIFSVLKPVKTREASTAPSTSPAAVMEQESGYKKVDQQDDQPVVSNSVTRKITNNSDSIAEMNHEEVVINESIDSLRIETSQEKPIVKAHGVSIKISVAPDFSSTEVFNQGKPGIGFGITGGYNVTKHVSIFTGVIFVKKVYSSTNVSEAYSTQSGYNYPIEKLEGNCRILDLPLNVYYSFNQDHALSFKVGVGFSSYIMLDEEYTYTVDKPYGNNIYSQRIENENNEWFKMANVSVSMQKRLTNTLFLEVEPFIKIPIAGIGAGDISLYTIGAFASLRFDLYKVRNYNKP